MSASASLPAQVVFAQPVAVISGPGAPGTGGSMQHHHHSQQHGHLHHHTHSMHAMSPPPLPPAGLANVSYPNFVSAAPGAGAGPGSDGHHAYAHTPPPYLSHHSERRLPSIRDLNFGSAGGGGHNNPASTQQQQQLANAVSSSYSQISPTNSVSGINTAGRPPPVMTSGPGMSGPGNTTVVSSSTSMSTLGGAGTSSVPADIVMTPIRQRSGHFRLPSNHSSASSGAPQQQHSHSPNLSGYAQPQQLYPGARRQRTETNPGGGMPHTGRPLSSAGMSLTSPISATGRSPLVSQAPYGYPTPHSSATSSLSHHQQVTTPHSPYSQAFPSPHTPHHHLHTPSSLGPHPAPPPQSQPHQHMQHASQQQQQPYGSYEYGYGGYQSNVSAPPTGSAYPPPAHASAPVSSASAQYASEKQQQQQQQQDSWAQQQPPTPIMQQSSQPYPPSHYTFIPPSAQPRQAPGLVGGGHGGRAASAGAQAHQNDTLSPQTQYAPSSKIHGGVEDVKAQYIKKIQEHCYVLYTFAKQYENTTSKPSQAELDEMARRAQEVVTMLAYVRRIARDEAGAALPSPAPEDAAFYHQTQPLQQAESQAQAYDGSASAGTSRGPKRSWADVGDEDDDEAFSPSTGRKPSFGHPPGEEEKGWDGDEAYGGPDNGAGVVDVGIGGEDAGKSAAEKDMALIRRKRATQQVPQNTPKGKYRKRSRATPPGKCHSCNIRETPEWRRGPDGARTLCNACGLHYAKLCRKREKVRQANDAAASLGNAAFGLPTSSASSSGNPSDSAFGVGIGMEVPPEIDMDMLRKSTRAANERELAKADRERSRFRGAGGKGGGGGGMDMKGESSEGGGGGVEGDGSPNSSTKGQGQMIGLGLGGLVPSSHALQSNGVNIGALGISTNGDGGGGDGRRPGTAGGDSNGESVGGSQGQWRPYAEGQSSYLRAGPAPVSSGVRTGSAGRVAATSA